MGEKSGDPVGLFLSVIGGRGEESGDPVGLFFSVIGGRGEW